MFRKRKLIRGIAVFLILNTLCYTFLPTIAYALTSGPTVPEATSFEPVDTTDMVNLATGDLVYNIPLLEVPGPSGGYPLSLSYHAGIQPNEEASWVGLGWTLNPGAITRTVSGYPDDHENVTGVSRQYWKGGETHTIEVGGVIGIAGAIGASAGLSISHDTYQGFGVGQWMGVSVGADLTEHLGVGINGRIGISPFGSPYASAGIGLGIGDAQNEGIQLGASIGISTNFETVSGFASGGVDVGYGMTKGKQGNSPRSRGGASLLGASISTTPDGAQGQISVGGVNDLHNSKAGKITTSTSGFTLPLPFVHLGYKYRRYWIDETEVTQTNGTLYYPSAHPGDYRKTGFDTYSLLDPTETGGILQNPDPDKVLGGSFPDYDLYSVNAQGLSGNMRPYHYKGYLARQSKYNEDNDKAYYEVKHMPLGLNTNPPNFRFVGDFSNRFEYTGGSGFSLAGSPIDYSFDGAIEAGLAGGGYDANRNILAGSKHVEYFTNLEIKDASGIARSKGFVDTKSTGFVRANDSQIGGFKILNASGVTYHFALPAYSYDEYQRTDNTNLPPGDAYNTSSRPTRYAYTWFLTAVTGPDYVDRNNDGFLDDGDWGYWVEFDYGLWVDNYIWRNPALGFHKDLDNDFKHFSSGRKQIYYLDAIRTKTHTALFVKNRRYDGKGIAVLDEVAQKKEGEYQITPGDHGFEPKEVDVTLTYGYIYARSDGSQVNPNRGYMLNPPLPVNPLHDRAYCTKTFRGTLKPTSLLQLESIILVDNEKLSSILAAHNVDNLKGHNERWNQTSDGQLISTEFDGYQDHILEPPHNICDEVIENDEDFYLTTLTAEDFFSSGTHLGNNVITVNNTNGLDLQSIQLRSVEMDTDHSLASGLPNSFDIATPLDKYGRLTLNAVEFRGKGGSSLIPPMTFEYDKNPGYDKDAYDIWGFYKPDFDANKYGEDVSTNDNLLRMVSPASHQELDAWSLTKIGSSLGASITIDYSGKSYNISIYTSLPYYIQSAQIVDANRIRLTFFESFNEDLRSFVTPGDIIELSAIFRHFGIARSPFEIVWCIKNGDGISRYFYWDNFNKSGLKVESIGPNYIEIIDADLYDLMHTALLGEACECFGENNGVNAWYDFNDPPKFIGGHVFFENSFGELGGGIKVDQIKIDDGLGTVKTTKYNYSKGYTSFSPINFVDFVHIKLFEDRNLITDAFQDKEKEALLNYFNFSNAQFSDLLANLREVPAPGVIYKKVQVTEWVNGNKLPGHAEYEFQPFNSDMASIEPSNDQFGSGGNDGDGQSYSRALTRKITIKDQMSRVGSLKSITLFDDDNNPVSKTTNHYLFENSSDYESDLAARFNKQGFMEETFAEARIVRKELDGGGHEYQLHGVESQRKQYPNIQVSQTNENFKTGITTVTKNLAFDFFSGEVTETLTEDGYGNFYVTKTTPAYQKYPGMGLAMHGGANMLIQEAASEMYKVDNAVNRNPTGLVSASVQTWSDQVKVLDAQASEQSGIWRKHRSFSFLGNDIDLTTSPDRLYPYANFTEFDAWDHTASPLPIPTQWQKNSEIKLYDPYSHALEAVDVNSNFAATKMDFKQERVLATVANASYDEFACSGAEDWQGGNFFGGDVAKGAGVVYSKTQNSYNTHSGDKVLGLAAGNKGFGFTSAALKENKTYRVSVWSNSQNMDFRYAVNNGTPQTIAGKTMKQAGSWYLLRANITIPPGTSDFEIFCQANAQLLLDDFRFHPIDAAMTSYVYNEWGELSHILDVNNLYTEYEYDAMGRLLRTYRETFDHQKVKASEVVYYYARTFLDKHDRLSAEFTCKPHEMINRSIVFRGADNSALEGTTTYTWRMGDGDISQSTAPTEHHAYSSTGYYQVSLIVDNQDAGSKQMNKMVRIYDEEVFLNVCADGYRVYDLCAQQGVSQGSCLTNQANRSNIKFNVRINNPATACPQGMLKWYYTFNDQPAKYWIGTGSKSNTMYYINYVAGTYKIFCETTDHCGNLVTSQPYVLTLQGEGCGGNPP